VLGKIKRTDANKVLRAAWPRDEHAALLLKAAQQPTRTTDFISYDQIGAFRSIAPGSAALRPFDIKVPHVASVWPKPVFV
jgi:hypothetical protein